MISRKAATILFVVGIMLGYLTGTDGGLDFLNGWEVVMLGFCFFFVSILICRFLENLMGRGLNFFIHVAKPNASVRRFERVGSKFFWMMGFIWLGLGIGLFGFCLIARSANWFAGMCFFAAGTGLIAGEWIATKLFKQHA